MEQQSSPSSTSPQRTSEIDIGFYRKQLEAFVTLSTDLLFGGASEGGKSIFIKLATIIWCTVVPGLQVSLYRKFYKDVVKNHMTGELNYNILCRQLVKDKIVQITENEVRWVHTGSLISLHQLRTEEDFEKAQGIPKHVLIVDEATQCKKHHIVGIRGWTRMSEDMKNKLPGQLRPLMNKCAEIFAERWPGEYPPGYPNYTDEQLRNFFPRVIQTANPIGQSVGYFRRQFVLARKPGTIWQTSDEEGGFLRQFIPSLVTDNPSADQEAQRKRLTSLGKKVADALIYGDWAAPGGDFFPEWDEEIHVVEDFIPPQHWFKYRVLDTGYAEPFYCGWYAVSDGEEFQDQQGRTRWLPAGALVLYREWNGCDPEDPAKGLRMRNADIADGILKRTPEVTSGITLTDRFPFRDTGMGQKEKKRMISTEFEDAGLKLKLANTARKTGWSLFRDRLIGVQLSEEVSVPLFYVMRCCPYAIEYIPTLTYHERDPEDAQEDGEATHSCFTGDTKVMTPFGDKRIDSLRAGDWIIAGDGVARRCSWAGVVREKPTITLSFTDGTQINCTDDHLFFTPKGKIPACDTPRYSCIIKKWKHKNLMGWFTRSIMANATSSGGRSECMLQYGNTTMALSQRINVFIIKIITLAITRLATLSLWAIQSTDDIMQGCRTILRNQSERSRRPLKRLLSGIGAKRVRSGIERITMKLNTGFTGALLGTVIPAVTNGQGPTQIKDFAPTDARRRMLEMKTNIQLRDPVSFVATPSGQTNGGSRSAVENHALLNCDIVGNGPVVSVYCLTEPVTGSFLLSNGLKVKNCDCHRYACAAFPKTVSNPVTTQEQLLEEAEKDIFTFAGARKAVTTQKKRSGRSKYGT